MKIYLLPEFYGSIMLKTRSISLVAMLLGSLVACDTTKKQTETPAEATEYQPISYDYEMQSLEKTSENCVPETCSEVTINYPVFAAGHDTHAAINSLLTQEINSTLSDYILEAEGTESTDELSKMFMASYQDFKENFPESITPWYIRLEVEVGKTDRNFISLVINHSSYTGGAQPNSSISYLNISADGEKIEDLDFFVNSTSKLQDLAEKEFRKANGIAPDEQLSDRGFLFDNDQFSLSEDFGVSQSGIVFYYNPDEISSDAEGPTLLTIPFKELAGLYKHKMP